MIELLLLICIGTMLVSTIEGIVNTRRVLKHLEKRHRGAEERIREII